MAKPLKIILLVVGGLVLLVIAALIAVALLFDPNDYRGQIQDKVQEETGREFALGDIKLSVFPWLSVQLSDARLGNAAGFGEQSFAEIQQVKVGVKLLPLLFDQQVQRSEEHTSEIQSLMRHPYSVFCLKKKKQYTLQHLHL